jgi:hypothetical protein
VRGTLRAWPSRSRALVSTVTITVPIRSTCINTHQG